MQTQKLFTMTNDKSEKQLLNFINARNKRYHDNCAR